MKSKGFTLIELVVVIVILGILVAVAIPKYVDITEKAKRAADMGQVAALRSATHMLYASNILASATNASGGYWPTETAVWASLTQTNAWKYFTTVAYTIADGRWATTPAE